MGKTLYFYGMHDHEVNTFIGTMKKCNFLNCVNGKAFFAYNKANERVLVLRAGVMGMLVGSGSKTIINIQSVVNTPAGVRYEKQELMAEIRDADKIFIPFSTVAVHPRFGKRKRNCETEDDLINYSKSEFQNHGNHVAILLIVRGKNGYPDNWLKFDVMITPDTIVSRDTRNKRFYSGLRRKLITEYFQTNEEPYYCVGRSIPVQYGFGVLNYCALVVCRIIEDLSVRTYYTNYNPCRQLKRYSYKFIREMRKHGHVVGGPNPPADYTRQLKMSKIQKEAYSKSKANGEPDMKGEMDIDIAEVKLPNGPPKKRVRLI